MANSLKMTLPEVAAYFNWLPQFVEKLAQEGRLPGRLAGDQWEFDRAQLVAWLDEKLQLLDSAELKQFERDMVRGKAAALASTGILAAWLRDGFVDLELDADSKPGVLAGIVHRLGQANLTGNPAALLDSIREREQLCSTALPGGVAVVHPRTPSPRWSRRPLLGLTRTFEPVEFDAIDRKPTRLFFVLLSHEERAHLHVLARLIRILRGPLLPALHSAPNQGSVLEIVRRAEEDLDRAALTPRPAAI